MTTRPSHTECTHGESVARPASLSFPRWQEPSEEIRRPSGALQQLAHLPNISQALHHDFRTQISPAASIRPAGRTQLIAAFRDPAPLLIPHADHWWGP